VLRLTVRASTLALALVSTGCAFGGDRGPTPLRAMAAAHMSCPTEERNAVVALVNDIRHRAGLRLLGNDAYLARFAMARSAAMADDRRLSHSGWESGLRRAGLTDEALGENVAYNFDAPDAVVEGWMRSPGHRANILRPIYKRIGVGCVIDDRGHRWWTQDFAG
jgi:uncharacterized protein YkwD